MKFVSLEVHNFFSISRAVLEFHSGLHFVEGLNHDMAADDDESNGSGKSSIFEALEWCLYGTVSRKLAKPTGVVNNKVGKNCLALVVFEHEGKTFKVRRTIRHDDYGTSLNWWLDGVEQTKHETTATKQHLAEQLPLPHTVFRHAVMVGQGMPEKFLDLPENAKQEFLCQIVDLDIYERAAETLKSEETALQEKANLLVGSIATVSEQIDTYTAAVTEADDSLLRFDREEAPSADNLQAQIEQIDREVAQYRENQKVLHQYIADQEEEESGKSAALSDAQAAGAPALQALEAVKAEARRLGAERNQFEAIPDQCPTCGSALDRSNADVQLLRIDHALAETQQQLQQAQARYDAVAGSIGDAKAELAVVQQTLRKYRAQLPQYTAYFEKAQRQKDALSSTRANYERRRVELATHRNTTVETLQKLQEALPAKLEEQAGLENRLAHVRHLKALVPNLRAAATSQILDYINERVDHYMQVLSSGTMGASLVQVQHGKKSRINVDLKTPAGNYGASSGGERRRIDLAIFMALSDLLKASTGTACNLLIADEIMDGVSPVGIRKFMDLLRERADSGMCVFVMSHHPDVRNTDWTSTMLVEKRDGLAELHNSPAAV